MSETTKLEPELPVLPTGMPLDYDSNNQNEDAFAYTADQMRAYALSAIEDDRNKRAVSAVTLTDQMEEAFLSAATYHIEYGEDVYLKNLAECLKAMIAVAPDTPHDTPQEGKEAGALSDEEIIKIADSAELPYTIGAPEDGDMYATWPDRVIAFARAILAAQGGRKT